ncbi:MAG: A1 family peptidase [archaeon]|nr:A1 family peptidase [archaeon]
MLKGKFFLLICCGLFIVIETSFLSTELNIPDFNNKKPKIKAEGENEGEKPTETGEGEKPIENPENPSTDIKPEDVKPEEKPEDIKPEEKPEEKPEIEPEPEPEPEPKFVNLQLPFTPSSPLILQVGLGTPYTMFPLKIDLSSQSTWVPSTKCENCVSSVKYDPNKSSTKNEFFDMDTIINEEGSVTGEILSDKIKILGSEIENFTFISATSLDKKTNSKQEGILGLGRPEKEKISDSILSLLKDNNIINKELFSLRLSDPSHAEIQFGDQNKEIIDLKNSPFCPLTPKDKLNETYKNSWMCPINYLKLNDSILNLKGNANFDPQYNYIYAPYEHLTIFEKKIIKKYFGDKCRLFNDNWEFSYVCKIGALTEPETEEEKEGFVPEEIIDPQFIKDFEFVIGNYGFKLNTKDLFRKAGDETMDYELLLRFKKNEDLVWNFGLPFMQKFITAFDNENEKIYIQGDSLDYSKKMSDLDSEATGKKYLIKVAFGMLLGLVAIAGIFVAIAILTTHRDSPALLENEEK